MFTCKKTWGWGACVCWRGGCSVEALNYRTGPTRRNRFRNYWQVCVSSGGSRRWLLCWGAATGPEAESARCFGQRELGREMEAGGLTEHFGQVGAEWRDLLLFIILLYICNRDSESQGCLKTHHQINQELCVLGWGAQLVEGLPLMQEVLDSFPSTA